MMNALLIEAAEANQKAFEQDLGSRVLHRDKLAREIEGLVRDQIAAMPLMKDDLFWALLEALRAKLGVDEEGNVKLGDRTERNVEDFVWEFAFGSTAKKCGVEADIYVLMSFVKTYEEKVHDLYGSLFDVIEGFGDDGFNDLIDSFPLFGRVRYEKALKGEIEGTSRQQYQGENYIRTALYYGAVKYYGSVCRSAYAEVEFGSEEEGEE
jgi:hypothetical protein